MYNKLLNLLHDGAPVTCIIMLTIFVFSIMALKNRSFFMKMILHPYSIYKEKEYYRLFTSDLVHNDLIHLLLNELMLYGICASLEEYLRQQYANGSWLFLCIYLTSY